MSSNMPNRNSFRQKLKLFRRLILVLFLIVIGGIALILFGRMEDSVEGRGTVLGLREYELKSSVQSRIAKIHFRNGDTVNAGDVLLELDDRELQEKISSLENRVRELEAEIEARSWSLKVLRHDPLPQEYRHTEITLSEYREREIKSKHELEIFQDLSRKGAVSALELQQKQLKYLKEQKELEKLEEDYNKLKNGLAADILKQAETELELLRQKLASKRSELALSLKHDEDYKIRAPEDGTISYIPTKRGIYVEPGQTLSSVAAKGQKKFTAYIDEKDIYKVREGQVARIESSQYNYFEYGYFYGKVYAVDELPELRGSRNCYGVRILLEESKLPLRLGSTGNAEIIVGRDFIFKIITGLR